MSEYFVNRLMALMHGRVLTVDEAETTEADAAPAAAAQEPIRKRVGFWAIRSEQQPEQAMGVMLVLAALLERWGDIRVYRLLSRIGDDPKTYLWSMAESQVSVDDWQLDGLDENIAVWGTLTSTDHRLTLTLQLENDLIESDDVVAFDVSVSSLPELIRALPALSDTLVDALGVVRHDAQLPAYTDDALSNAVHLTALLTSLFRWENALYLSLWGVAWSEADAQAQLVALLDNAEALKTDFAGWSVAHAVGRAVQAGRTEPFTHIDRLLGLHSFSASFAPVLATLLYQANYAAEAYRLLNAALETYPDVPEVRLTLAGLALRERQISQAVEILQSAIEDDAVNAALYRRYGALVDALRKGGLILPQFALSTLGERSFETMTDEALAAYDEALALAPEDVQAAAQRALLLLETGDDEVWQAFQQVIDLDPRGDAIRLVADALTMLDTSLPAVDSLRAAVRRTPDVAHLSVSLAVALLANDMGDEALETLDRAAALTQDDDLLDEIERLRLSAYDPNFERRLGEIIDSLAAGSTISLAEIDYLEENVAQAPNFAQLYLLLAQAYTSRGDDGAALETLLDGQQTLPEDTEIVEQLVRLLWQADERALAFDHLNKALAHDPNSVPLLALTGLYLFEEEQYDEARAFLARAESLSVAHPVLREVRRKLSDLLND